MPSVFIKVKNVFTKPHRGWQILRQRFWFLSRKCLLRKMRVHSYISRASVKMLHLGCGPNCFDGWLNTDLDPMSNCEVIIDASRKFPLPSNSMDMVYCEHLLEHLDWTGGIICLQECFRVLRPNGILRISTPDFERLINFYIEENSENTEYMKFGIEHFVRPLPLVYSKALVVNNFFRSWGHQVIYDYNLLREVLELVGFVNISRQTMFKSDHQHLNNVDTNDYAHRFESIIVEAAKL